MVILFTIINRIQEKKNTLKEEKTFHQEKIRCQQEDF